MKRLLFSALLCLLTFTTQAAVEINGIAARVNGKVITKKEVAILMQPRLMAIQAQIKSGVPLSPKKTNDLLKKAEQEILQELIDNKLILSELEAREAGLPDHVVEQDMQRVIKEVYGGSEKKFREDLKKAGTTWAKYKELQKDKILVQAFKGQTIGKVPPPTEAELEAERAKMRELPSARDFAKDKIIFEKIYIMRLKENRNRETGESTPVDPKEQDKLAETVMAQLKAGSDFASLAREHSDDGYAQDGGRSEPTTREDLNADFAALMFDSPIGELVGPIPDRAINKETEKVVVRGYTILRVIKVELGPAKPMKELRPIISSRVTAQKRRAKFERWIGPKRETAIIHKSM